MPWQTDKDLTDEFLPAAERVVRCVVSDLVFIEPAPSDVDMHEATDLIVDGARNWGWRMRKPDCTFRDFTIRYRRPQARTEWDKILKGHTDYYLYAWTDEETWQHREFSEWVVVDMNAVRNHHKELLDVAAIQGNPDGSSSFLAWPVFTLVRYGCVSASWMEGLISV